MPFRRHAPVALCCVLLTISSNLLAGTLTWNNTTGPWSVGANWGGAGPTGNDASDILNFGGSDPLAYTSTNDVLAVPFLLNQFVFGSTAPVAEIIAGEHGHVGVAAGAQRLVQVLDFADHARASRVVRLQRRALQPALHDVRAARPGLRIVDEPDPRSGRRRRVERGEAGIERLVVHADRHQHDRQRARQRSPAARHALTSGWTAAAATAPSRGSGGCIRRSGRPLPARHARWWA